MFRSKLALMITLGPLVTGVNASEKKSDQICDCNTFKQKLFDIFWNEKFVPPSPQTLPVTPQTIPGFSETTQKEVWVWYQPENASYSERKGKLYPGALSHFLTENKFYTISCGDFEKEKMDKHTNIRSITWGRDEQNPTSQSVKFKVYEPRN